MVKVKTEIIVPNETSAPVVEHPAYGIIENQGTWGVMKIMYNLSGNTQTPEFIPCGNKEDAIYRFKVLAGGTLM